MAEPTVDRGFPIPRLAASLCAIAVLALGLPYAAVQAFHQWHLDTADRQLEAMAAGLGPSLASGGIIPAGTELLAGRGAQPVFRDEAWTTARALPLVRVWPDPGPDPWGNAYLVNIRERGRAWVISAGPDGILQTPFTSGTASPAGDDRIAPIR